MKAAPDWSAAFPRAIVSAPVAILAGAGASKPLKFALDGELFELFRASKPAHLTRALGNHSVSTMADLFAQLRPALCADPDSPDWFSAAATRLQALEFVMKLMAGAAAGLSWDLWEPLWTVLGERLKPRGNDLPTIPVFTTNYDQVFENMCSHAGSSLRLHTGFIHNNTGLMYAPEAWNHADFGWSRDGYLKSIGQHSSGPRPSLELALFKLHGSVDWLRNDDPTAMVQRINFRGFNPGNLQTAAVYLGRLDQAPTTQPFADAYGFLDEWLNRSGRRLLVVAGYGFADAAVFQRVRAALERDKHLRIHIHDVDPDKVAAKLGPCSSGTITCSRAPGDCRLFTSQSLDEIGESVALALGRDRPWWRWLGAR